MAGKPAPSRRDGPLDAARGRTDGAPELRRLLPFAPLPYVQGALENPELGEDEMVHLLRNRSAAASLLLRVARERRFSRSYEVRKALVRHPKTPLTLARTLLPQLYWKDLAALSDDARVQPGVRRQAEETLARKLGDMTEGEKVNLARRAGRGVIAVLRESEHTRVLKALLGNGRVVEADAIRIASRAEIPRDVLSVLAEHPSWGRRYAVRRVLVANPRTPVAAALRLMEDLPDEDLRRLLKDDDVPRIVRVGAERRLETGVRRARSRRRG